MRFSFNNYCLTVLLLSGFLSFAIAVVKDKLFANVVNADRAFNLGKRGIVRRPSRVQSMPVFGPLSLNSNKLIININ
ncbi:hypothetical protein PUN28_004078 [Cardiocondyla obscurior]|uniref:Uncharacterized protein n=1 Tax=Cardiocondyla obscurior TaxID=286306 RepID=A0AAW2GPG5_9HYME